MRVLPVTLLMSRQDDEVSIRLIEGAAIPVSRRRKLGAPRCRIETETGEDARLVWSVLDRDRCFVEESPGHIYNRPPQGWWTWYPAGPIFRFLGDVNARMGVVIFALFPFAILFALAYVREQMGAVEVLASAVVLGGAYWALLAKWLGGPGVFDVATMRTRFIIGMTAGAIWAFATRLPLDTILEFAAAGFLTFLAANGLWLGTIGYHRYLFVELFGRVGDPLPREEARRILADRAKSARQKKS